MLKEVLESFGIKNQAQDFIRLDAGLINDTWKVITDDGAYVLQRINKNVFHHPEQITENLTVVNDYLKANGPENYIFVAPLPTTNGRYLAVYKNEYYRLSPFVQHSHTVNFMTDSKLAFEAARQFGRLTKLLNGFDCNKLHYTLPDFHNLNLRMYQFREALKQGNPERIKQAAYEIDQVQSYSYIADIYQEIINDQQVPLRVVHHDAKVSNVLFNDEQKGLCVIDLDTIMPGYFISDVGDMMRTYLSAANEEEKEFDKIVIREDYFAQIYLGYLEEMKDILTASEKKLFIYSGKYLIFMQAVRFLTDFLNGDHYYQTKYPGHNWVRARNQLTLLHQYVNLEDTFNRIIAELDKGVVLR